MYFIFSTKIYNLASPHQLANMCKSGTSRVIFDFQRAQTKRPLDTIGWMHLILSSQGNETSCLTAHFCTVVVSNTPPYQINDCDWPGTYHAGKKSVWMAGWPGHSARAHQPRFIWFSQFDDDKPQPVTQGFQITSIYSHPFLQRQGMLTTSSNESHAKTRSTWRWWASQSQSK